MGKIAFRGYCLNGCGNPIFSGSFKAKYCSAACAKLRFDRQRGVCAYCGNKLQRKQRKYCTLKCAHAKQFQMRAAKLEQGSYPPRESNYFVRRYLIERFGEKCSRCGWATRHSKTGRVPVEVEHIDGDYGNNRLDNLTLLCPNCHSLTDTFRGLNRGRGRSQRVGGRENPLPRNPVFKDSANARPE